MHSTSSQCSSASRPRTKAALKGYENLKVSIPTIGLDLQQALDRSPNSNACKLAALADIALSNDVPGSLMHPRYSSSDKINTCSPKSSPHSTTQAKSPTKYSPSLIFVSDSAKLALTEAKNKTFEATFNVSPKKKKRSTGNRASFKERKKKQRSKSIQKNVLTSSAFATSDAAKPKDVYDFEESHDSIEDAIIPLTHTRLNKSDSANVANKAEEQESAQMTNKQSPDEAEDESSYSDRDDFYNFNSVSGSGTEEDQEEATGVSEGELAKSKKGPKPVADSQKTSLIRRIFKNAKKNSGTPNDSKKEETTKPIPKKELDEIFDNLRSKPNKVENEDKEEVITPNDSEQHDEVKVDLAEEQNEMNDRVQQRVVGKSRKSREVASLEAEWGMSMEQIKELIGVGKRKTQRRCATNRQNKFVETWSSDEYEEFHSTKDIIALIQEAEMRAQRSKAKLDKQHSEATAANAHEPKVENATASKTNSECKSEKSKEVNKKGKTIMKSTESNKSKPRKTTFSDVKSEDSDFDEHWNKTAKRSKIRNRRRTIASREDILVEDSPKSKPRANSKQMDSSIEAKNTLAVTDKKREIKETKETKEVKEMKETKETTPSTIDQNEKRPTKDGKPMPRRKRIASEMLYYWSSSSDEEFGRIEPSEMDDEDNNDGHLEQHGWIVGDSHKKLVTLLAHAKGKKIEDCGVKESVHKRK